MQLGTQQQQLDVCKMMGALLFRKLSIAGWRRDRELTWLGTAFASGDEVDRGKLIYYLLVLVLRVESSAQLRRGIWDSSGILYFPLIQIPTCTVGYTHTHTPSLLESQFHENRDPWVFRC